MSVNSNNTKSFCLKLKLSEVVNTPKQNLEKFSISVYNVFELQLTTIKGA